MSTHYVRNGAGKPIACCWGPCWERADSRYAVEVPHDAPKFPGEKLIYTFCRDRCRMYWLEANRPGRFGRAAAGERRTPLGLYLPG